MPTDSLREWAEKIAKELHGLEGCTWEKVQEALERSLAEFRREVLLEACRKDKREGCRHAAAPSPAREHGHGLATVVDDRWWYCLCGGSFGHMSTFNSHLAQAVRRETMRELRDKAYSAGLEPQFYWWLREQAEKE